MKRLFFIGVFISVFTVNAQTIFGKWENKDEETGNVDSVIELYEKNGKAYAKIIEITDKDRREAVCDKCSGKKKGLPILGMNILSGLTKQDDEWSGGKILDPKNGKEYKCYIKLEGKNKLKIRGYIGFSLIGRTTYWIRKLD